MNDIYFLSGFLNQKATICKTMIIKEEPDDIKKDATIHTVPREPIEAC
jgi:hypothetical protein